MAVFRAVDSYEHALAIVVGFADWTLRRLWEVVERAWFRAGRARLFGSRTGRFHVPTLPARNPIARKMFGIPESILWTGREQADLVRGMTYRTIEELKGETLTLIERNQNEEIVLTCASGRRFRMFHDQDCCESVAIGSVDGDLHGLIGSAIIRAKEEPGHEDGGKYESVTFTDFVLATETSEVTIHWIGESSGYYSESVEFIELTK